MRCVVILFMAACVFACGARTELPTTRPHSPLCGNGVIDEGEACDLGAANSDAPTFAVTQNGKTFQVRALVGNQSAVSFYNYIGASSHSGLEVENESRLYLYSDDATGALDLVINHNIYGKSGGDASMDIAGLPVGFRVDLSDDGGELVATNATSAHGAWSWSRNTDGGVIGGLCHVDWTIVATPTFGAGISTWVWVDGDQSRKPLDMSQPVTVTPTAQCHTDCTLPSPCGS